MMFKKITILFFNFIKAISCDFLILPLAFIFAEISSRLFMFGFEATGIFTVVLSSLFFGCAFGLANSFLNNKYKRYFTSVVLFVLAVIYSFNLVYHGIFHSFFSYSTLGLAADAAEFWKEALTGILNNFHKIVTVFIPAVAYLIFKSKIPECKRDKIASAIGTAASGVALVLAILLSQNAKDAFFYININAADTYKHYGVSMSGCVDLWQTAFGAPVKTVENPYAYNTDDSPQEEAVEVMEVIPDYTPILKPIEYNKINIDFKYLSEIAPNKKIKDMHEYFASVPLTEKNDYTGMFKGKNLIFLSLEGFCDKFIDRELTPTLYRMYTQGFKFNNFYASLWGGSTATGEYANMTGNFYSSANCIKNSANTLQHYSLGNIFKREGYKTYAYHNHTYTYYGRDKSHPNFGYEIYKGVGNGLKLASNVWPNSDEELAVSTIDEYINGEMPFHVYYMTVSGHANYTWMGNNMARRNRNLIPEDSDYSDNVKAYISCQLEVEKMLTVLVDKLSEAGILDDTVFAMSCDHYPYALSDSELSELYGLEEEGIRSNFDLYRNSFILWSSSMESPIEVDSLCSAYDIVPTLANLFGAEYDSRLITGKDILSNHEKIVILCALGNGSSWNWISEKGIYDANKKIFVPSVNMTEEEAEEYKNSTNQKIAAMRTYSYAILDNNYYKYVFDKGGQVIAPEIPEQPQELPDEDGSS